MAAKTPAEIWEGLNRAARDALLRGDGRFYAACSEAEALVLHVPTTLYDMRSQHPYTVLTPLGKRVAEHGRKAGG